MEEKYVKYGFRKRKSRLAIVYSAIAVAALGLQIGGVATNYWITITFYPREWYIDNAGLWETCPCVMSVDLVCRCEGIVREEQVWYKAFAVITLFWMALVMFYEFVDILWEQTSTRNAVRYFFRTLTFLCATRMLVVFGVRYDGYYRSRSASITHLGYSFVLCAVAAALTGINVLIGIGEICMRKPTQGGVVSNPGVRDTTPVVQQDVMALEHDISVQQQRPDYYNIDMQRDGPEASAY